MIITVHVAKANHTFTFDTATLPTASVEYGTDYGFRQCVTDTVAGVKRSDYATEAEFNAAALAKAQKRVDQLESGNVPGSRAPADPKLAAAKKFAKDSEAVGLDLATISPEELVKMAEYLNRQRAKAGQTRLQA